MGSNKLSSEQSSALHVAALSLTGVQTQLALSSGMARASDLQLKHIEGNLMSALENVRKVRAEMGATE